MENEEILTEENNPAFYKLWNLHEARSQRIIDGRLKKTGEKDWYDYEIYAKTTRDIEMDVWNGNHHPSVEANCKKHICKAGTRVRVWMVSRFGDVGITDNLKNPKGYDARGLDADKDLTDYEFIDVKK